MEFVVGSIAVPAANPLEEEELLDEVAPELELDVFGGSGTGSPRSPSPFPPLPHPAKPRLNASASRGKNRKFGFFRFL
jgi:hypothetical protein